MPPFYRGPTAQAPAQRQIPTWSPQLSVEAYPPGMASELATYAIVAPVPPNPTNQTAGNPPPFALVVGPFQTRRGAEAYLEALKAHALGRAPHPGEPEILRIGPTPAPRGGDA